MTAMDTDVNHVLVVDDDALSCRFIEAYLGRNNFRVTSVGGGGQMREVLDREAIDIVLLDIRLPGEDGYTLARQLRDTSTIPIVMLTSCMDEADRVMGLELGADDFVTKPFSPRELLARIRSVIRRSRFEAAAPRLGEGAPRAYRFAGWELNVRLLRLTSPVGRRIPISNGEFHLLSAFLSAPQRVLSRDQLLEMSRLHSTEVYDRAVDVQIMRLRRKIEVDPSNPMLIKTERGAGYVFDAPVVCVR